MRPSRLSFVVAAAASLVLLACPGASPVTPIQKQPPPTQASTVLPPPSADGRLPALAVPRAYALELDIDPNKERFSGVVRIEVDVPLQTSFVVMHGRGLTIRGARAVIDRAAPINALSSTRLNTGGKVPEELVLAFAAPLPAGHATLVLEYEAPFNPELAGIYRIKDGDSWYVFSQFEATDARRAFPCFDEPGFKVPFDLAITIPSALKAVANTSETMREDVPPGRTRVRFARTQPLPTYLVALAVGDLAIEQATRSTRPPVRIITTKKSAKSATNKLALETTGALIDALSTWFGIPYPYDKLDVVAVPALSAGAMENPGLVTFRDEILLVDPARASTTDRREQAIVVAHELAHQWFGDLVTATWWTDLWLNEGMATWMESRIVDTWHPEWGVKYDAVGDALDVMRVDGLVSARAVRQPAVSTSDIEEAFDGITYEKGAAILSTIEHWIGEAAFKKGLRDYLQTNAHKSVPTTKLFEALDRASGKDVTGLASGYLDQPGVPEVVADIECEQGARWHVELGSRTWRPWGSTMPDDDTRAWNIPVCVRVEGQKADQCVDLIAGAPSLVAGRGACPKFAHPNATLNYYRWSLPPKTFVSLAQGRAQLDVGTRLALLSNAWAAVRAGDLDAKYLLDILPPFDAETARQPVAESIAILREMSDAIVDDEARAPFKKFALARLAKRKKALGWESPGPKNGDEALLRRSVLFAMADLVEDDATLREAEEYARKWLADPASVDPEIASVAVEIASRKAGDERIDALVAAIKKPMNEQDHAVALRALGGFDNPAQLEHALDRTLTADIDRSEVRNVVDAAVHRRLGRPTAEEWLQKHWDALRTKMPGLLSLPLVRSVGNGCTPKEADDIMTFYAPHAAEIEGAARDVKLATESVTLCVALRRRASPTLHNALLGIKPRKP